MQLKTMVTTLALCLGQGAGAADAERYGVELSPVGAIKAGNADASIPPLGARDAAPPGWTFGKTRHEFWSHSQDKPLFSIDAANVDKYAARLTPSQIALLKQTKGYRMDIYPSHRGCGYPDFAQANTRTNLTRARIGADGWSLEDAVLPGVPFPMPKQGIEVMWNYLTLYAGVGAEWPHGLTYVSPRPGASDPISVTFEQSFYWPWGKKGSTSVADVKGLRSNYYFSFQSPAAFAGQAFVQSIFFKDDAESFMYFPGQRRVRRLPAYTYDAPIIGFESQYPVDAFFMFSGNPDRFNWKLVGKKELYIPYNNFKLNDGALKMGDVFQEHAINPELRRYELHRVWVVEGTVKPGMRHTASKKVMYFDEDSWIPAVGDDYDVQGKLWKSKELQSLPSWELGACVPTVTASYDLSNGRYLVDNDIIEAGKGNDIRWYPEAGNNPRLTSRFYTSDTLKANSER